MMDFFAGYVENKTKVPYPHKDRRIQYAAVKSTFFDILYYIFFSLRCLAHVINLAMQALIKSSKSKHYDPANPNEHLPDTDALVRDEVGLVRAIAVKVCAHTYEHLL